MISKEQLDAFQADDFLSGKLLLIDKPLGWTSFDAVAKLRWLIRKKFSLKKIKVGHAGTLDPLATGLLIICTGAYTKRIAALTLADKTYTGTFVLGATTPSYDLETEIEQKKSASHLLLSDVEQACAALRGHITQVPPQYSAKLVDGKRAYLSARKGKEVDIPAREVDIHAFEILDLRPGTEGTQEVDFMISCSKGTYIRAMARDLGEALGCGAYLSALSRTAVGNYQLKDALSITDCEDVLKKEGETNESPKM